MTRYSVSLLLLACVLGVWLSAPVAWVAVAAGVPLPLALALMVSTGLLIAFITVHR